jgi:hypothetical protein
MTRESSNSDSVVKKRGRKKAVKEEATVKQLGLFDHVKHVRSIQNPNYYKNLSELDKKTFNPFMILKALSMNPALVDDISTLFRYFDKVPHAQFYQLLIGLIPPDKRFYPWVKAKKKPFSKRLLELIAQYFEISEKEATEYAVLLSSTDKGKQELVELCGDFGLSEKEVEAVMKGKDDDIQQ